MIDYKIYSSPITKDPGHTDIKYFVISYRYQYIHLVIRNIGFFLLLFFLRSVYSTRTSANSAFRGPTCVSMTMFCTLPVSTA